MFASFYEGAEGEERLQRAMKFQSMRDRLLPDGSRLGQFYRSCDRRTATPLQGQILDELTHAVSSAIEVETEAVRHSLVREVATLVAAAEMIRSHPRQTQLTVYYPTTVELQAEALIAAVLAE